MLVPREIGAYWYYFSNHRTRKYSDIERCLYRADFEIFFLLGWGLGEGEMPPRPCGVYAGIGGTVLQDAYGALAIADLFLPRE